MNKAQALGSRLVAARRRAGLSQAELAAASGVTQALVSRIEQGKIANPGVWTLWRIAAALLISLDMLLQHERNGHRHTPPV